MEILTSFNENIDILFDPIEHTYHHDREKLSSATGFVKDYEEQFDAFKMSAVCADKWQVDRDALAEMWESNGNSAAGFGTAIHAVLEHYFKHHATGQAVQEATGKEYNAALPNHPFLRQLIWSLEAIRIDGNTRQEALISAIKYGKCGLVDDLLILDEKKKTCRIRDYKITFDILEDKKPLGAPFAYLGSSKLSKNFLQLSFYGWMLSLSGWKVQGLDIYNWDGQWHHHKCEGVKLNKTMALIGSVCGCRPK